MSTDKKFLYHYTSRMQAEQIIKSGYLKLTPSNLIKPIDARIVKHEDGTFGVVSEISDPVKPVVWLTDSEDASRMGLECPNNPDFKKQVKIVVPMKDAYKWWVTWAERNHMNKKWFKAFSAGVNYRSWFVSEEIISLADVARIEDVKTGEVLYIA